MKQKLWIGIAAGAMLLSSQDCYLIAGAPSYSDTNTVALWLFDERQYPYTTLTDASQYQCDLRLESKGHLVPGRFGNALQVGPGSGYNLYFAEWMGSATVRFMRGPNGQPSGLWGPTITPGDLLKALAGNQWTWEFWLKLSSMPSGEVAVLDLGYGYDPGVVCVLAADGTSFKLTNHYGGYQAVCSTAAASLINGEWHHLAFIHTSGQVQHFFDGQLQPAVKLVSITAQPTPPMVYPPSLARPNSEVFDASKDYERFRSHRFNLSLGQDRRGASNLSGLLDEMRFSSVARYTSNFASPAGFSRNYGPSALPAAMPTGPPLLFSGAPKLPLQLGSRKHLFIDEAIIETKTNVQLVVNPPTNAVPIQVEGRSPQNVVGDIPFIDHNGKVYMVSYDGNDSEEGKTALYISDDGVNFSKPKLGVINYKGSTANNYVMHRVCVQGRAIRDLNPLAPAEEKFKISGNLANRGIYLYTSPDLLHWRRGETIMLPLMTGGGQELYWDDQRGRYACLLKRDSSFFNSEAPRQGGHTGVGFATTEITKPWPFHAMTMPYFEGWPVVDVSGEGPILFRATADGGVYRTRATKYEWAPDVYVAFLWRFQSSRVRQTQLAVSRDGGNWISYDPPRWYLPNGMTIGGKVVAETLMQDGMILRGGQIWHYAQYTTGPHGAGNRFHVRLTQRLDGFTSLDAGTSTGTVVTKPLVFAGSNLIVNLSSSGGASFALLDASGVELPGFGLSQCDPIIADSTNRTVTWQGNSNVGSLAGRSVQLKFELRNTKLYAFQFTQ